MYIKFVRTFNKCDIFKKKVALVSLISENADK